MKSWFRANPTFPRRFYTHIHLTGIQQLENRDLKKVRIKLSSENVRVPPMPFETTSADVEAQAGGPLDDFGRRGRRSRSCKTEENLGKRSIVRVLSDCPCLPFSNSFGRLHTFWFSPSSW